MTMTRDDAVTHLRQWQGVHYDVVRGHVGGGEGQGGVAVGLGNEECALGLGATCRGVVTLHDLVRLVGTGASVVQASAAI